MINTINLKLSKRLNNKGLLDDVETVFKYKPRYYLKGDEPIDESERYYIWSDSKPIKETEIPTLTLEELINICPGYITVENIKHMGLDGLAEYLLDNNHLGTKQKIVEHESMITKTQ